MTITTNSSKSTSARLRLRKLVSAWHQPQRFRSTDGAPNRLFAESLALTGCWTKSSSFSFTLGTSPGVRPFSGPEVGRAL
jgi:hypothetical protein